MIEQSTVKACAEGLQTLEVIHDLLLEVVHNKENPQKVEHLIAEALDHLDEVRCELSLEPPEVA